MHHCDAVMNPVMHPDAVCDACLASDVRAVSCPMQRHRLEQPEDVPNDDLVNESLTRCHEKVPRNSRVMAGWGYLECNRVIRLASGRQSMNNLQSVQLLEVTSAMDVQGIWKRQRQALVSSCFGLNTLEVHAWHPYHPHGPHGIHDVIPHHPTPHHPWITVSGACGETCSSQLGASTRQTTSGRSWRQRSRHH